MTVEVLFLCFFFQKRLDLIAVEQRRDRIFAKGCGFLSFAKNVGKNIGKNISKNMSGKYS